MTLSTTDLEAIRNHNAESEDIRKLIAEVERLRRMLLDLGLDPESNSKVVLIAAKRAMCRGMAAKPPPKA